MTWRPFFRGRRGRQLWYMPILGMAMAMMMARLLVMAHLMEIEEFGQFNAGLLLSTTFCMLGCLGIQSVLQRDMPVMFLRQRRRAAVVLLLQALMIACGCALLAIAICVPAFMAAGFSPTLTLIGILHGLSQQAFLIATVESRSLGDPLRYARQNFWRATTLILGGSAVADGTYSALHVLAIEAVLTLAFASAIVRRACGDIRPTIMALIRLASRRLPGLPWRSALVLLLVSTIGFASTLR